MPDYTLNPNRKPFASAGTVRGTVAIQTTSKGNEYARFNLSIDSNMALRQVTTFASEAVKEAKGFTDRDVVFVAGWEEEVNKDGRTYNNVTAKVCLLADKLYAIGGTSAPATNSAFTDISDDDLPFA